LLSGVPDTVLGVRPTDGRVVGCFAVFGVRSVDRCVDSRVFELPSWAFARQMSVLSGFLWFSVSVQSTDAWTLGGSSYRPGRSPDRWASCLVFCGFRYSFSRQIDLLSGVPDTVLGVRPTKKRSVGFFVVFGIRSVDRSTCSRGFWLLSLAFARQIGGLSGVLRFLVFVQLTDRLALVGSGYCPGRSPDKKTEYLLVSGKFYL
jgi:hypothetical protein